ncbi:unnamed protein product [Nippostrongylus brasiliensis]|uniref:Transposase n=1 Tax=Nippostrongylus brasiliensis TaxID=27835 RepID=A0A0N4XKH7_NIPBR|nr:unnamed protein product [Nippostrongylus brasiliensis]
MLAWPYGYARVMSGFSFLNRDQGPPNLGPFTGYAIVTDTKRIAFARLGKGFFALNAQDDTWNK